MLWRLRTNYTLACILASSSWTLASCSASSRLASRVRQRPRSIGMLSRKKMTPPTQIQYHVFHCEAVLAAASCTSLPCAWRYGKTSGGTLDSAVSCAAYGAIVDSSVAYGAMVCRFDAYGATFCRSGATAITPLMASLLFAIVVSTPRPLAPPPAAAIAWATSAGGILLGSLYLASWVNSAGWAWITWSSVWNFCALASWVASFCAMASTSGGIFCAVAVTFGGIFCAVAMTLAGTFWAAAT